MLESGEVSSRSEMAAIAETFKRLSSRARKGTKSSLEAMSGAGGRAQGVSAIFEFQNSTTYWVRISQLLEKTRLRPTFLENLPALTVGSTL